MTQDQRTAIIEGLRAGKSYRDIAAATGCGHSTVGNVAKAAGIEVDVQRTKKATAAKRDYDTTARLALINRFFDKAEEMLGECAKPHDLQSLATALAILVDKRRLEDGEATSRQEINQSGARDQALARITDIVHRRRAS